MQWNKKKIIAASALLLCLAQPIWADEPRPAEEGDMLLTAEEMAESRRVQFVVREDTAIEVDGVTEGKPSEVRGTTWIYDLPAMKLGRHHVKLTHPRTHSWEAVLMVTKDYPQDAEGLWDLSDKLDYSRVHAQEESVISKNEIWTAPLSGRIEKKKASLYREPTESAEKLGELTEGAEISIFGQGSLSGGEMEISAESLLVTFEDGSECTLTGADRITLVDWEGGWAQCEIEREGKQRTFITEEGNLKFVSPWYHVEVMDKDAPYTAWVKAEDVKVIEKK